MIWLALLPEVLGVAVAADAETPSVVIHAGRRTSVIDAADVEVSQETGVHRVNTPKGTFTRNVAVPGTPIVAGQAWFLDDVEFEVVVVSDSLVEFALAE